MKNINFLKGGILAIFAVFAVSQSCNNLDLQPLDSLTTDTYYKTAGDFDGAIFAAYSSIQDLWGTSTETLSERGEFWSITLTATDDVAINGKAGNNGGDYENARNLDLLQFRQSQTCWAAAYTQIYEGILRANIVIENVNGQNELTADQKAKFVAEAKFIRGMLHFLALQMWGTPPLALEVKKDINDLALSNATPDELYASILKDFQDAYTGLPATWDAGNTGRATKWAAKAYEGKVLVWQEKWADAITAFEAVEGSGTYDLFKGGAPLDNYEDAFDFAKENGKESIFEIQYGGPFSDDNLWVFDDTHSEAFKASQGTGRVWYFDVNGGATGFDNGGLGWFVPTQNLVDEYEAGDPRLTATIYKDGDTYYDRATGTLPYNPIWSSTTYSIRKYGGPRNAVGSAYSPNGQAGFNNERWYRYSEMLLLHAEALIRGGRTTDGVDIINNQIRSRVGLPATTIADPLKALQHERRVELALEGTRWFDITRWGIGPDVFGAAWNPKFKVFPFPEAEINRSAGKMKQNPGYE
jgi:starch-binding outer membrane protein, SusD/RagB family